MPKDFERVVSTGIAWARQVEEEERVVCTYGVVTAFPSDWIVQQELAGESNTYVMADTDFVNDWVTPSVAVREDGTSSSGTDSHPEPKVEPSPADPVDPPADPPVNPEPETSPAPAPDPAPAETPAPAPDPAPAETPAPAPVDVVNTAPADAVPVPDAGKHESPEEAAALVDATAPADPTMPTKVKEVPAPSV